MFFLTLTTYITAQEIINNSANFQEPSITKQQISEIESSPDFFLMNDVKIENMDLYVPTEPQDIPEDADWIFEIPVDVKNISSAVEEIVVAVFVFKTEILDTLIGRSFVRINLVNGAFTGKIIVGVSAERERMLEEYGYIINNSEAKLYHIQLRLSSSGESHFPRNYPTHPPFCMADASQPFRSFITGALPEAYKSEQ
jgi:hypothetical protein